MEDRLISNSRAQGLSLNVIIIAAIVLIVLIILWAIFTGKMAGFSKEMDECRGFKKYDACDEGYVNYPGNYGDYKYCCIRIGGETVEVGEPEDGSVTIE